MQSLKKCGERRCKAAIPPPCEAVTRWAKSFLRTAPCSQLLRYGPAGDPVSGISGWVGLHVVRLGVNHDCGPAVAEQRMAVVAEIHILVLNGELGRSAFRDGEISMSPAW